MVKQHNENLKENRYWMNVLDANYFYGEEQSLQLPEPAQRHYGRRCEELCEGVPLTGNEAVVVMLPKE
jgi:zinc protease